MEIGIPSRTGLACIRPFKIQLGHFNTVNIRLTGCSTLFSAHVGPIYIETLLQQSSQMLPHCIQCRLNIRSSSAPTFQVRRQHDDSPNIVPTSVALLAIPSPMLVPTLLGLVYRNGNNALTPIGFTPIAGLLKELKLFECMPTLKT